MVSSLNNIPIHLDPGVESAREVVKAELAALRDELQEKKAALRDKQTVVTELERSLQETRNLALQFTATPPAVERVQAEIDDLTAEIASLTAQVADVEAAAHNFKKEVGMADPALRGFDGEAAFLQTQLWVKGVALQLKKNKLARHEEASRVQPQAMAEPRGNGAAAVYGVTAQLETKGAIEGEVELTVSEKLDNLWASLQGKEPVLEALDAEIHGLWTEIGGLGERIARLEQASTEAQIEAETRTENMRASLEAEVGTLRVRIKDQEEEWRVKQAALEGLEQRLKTTVADFHAQLAEKETRLETRDGEIQRLKSEADGLLERIAHLEAAVERTQVEATAQAERLRDEAAVHESALRAQLHEKDEVLASTRGRIAELEESLYGKEGALLESEQRFSAAAAKLEEELATRGAALNDRNAQIEALRAEIRFLEEQAAEISRTLRETEEAGAREKEKLQAAFTAEAAALQARVRERDACLHEKELALSDLEGAGRARMQELELRLGEKHALLASRDAHIADLQIEKDHLKRQLQETSSELAEVEERAAARFEQLRRESLATVADLRARLQADEETLQKNQILFAELSQPLAANGLDPQEQPPEQPAAREGAEEALRTRIEELQTRLSEKQALVEERDGEIVKLKSEITALVERGDQMWAAARHAQAEVARQVEQAKQGLQAEVASLQARLREAEVAQPPEDASVGEIEGRFNLWLQDLQAQLSEKQALLASRDGEIERLRAEIRTLAQPSAQTQSAGPLMELESACVVTASEEPEHRESEALDASDREAEAALEKKPGEIIEAESDDPTKSQGGGPQVIPEQASAQGDNGDGLEPKADPPVPSEPALPTLVEAGESLPFSLLNLPPGVERATDLFPLKFMLQYKFVPVKLQDGSLAVAISDPADVYTLDAIAFQTGADVRVYACDERQIVKVLEQHSGPSSSMDRIIQDIEDEEGSADESEGDIAHLKDLASEAPVIRLVNLIIAKAVEDRASDIHIEPFEGSLRVRYRIDGLLVDTESPPPRLQAAIVSRIKLMAKMNIAERRLPQDGRIMMDIGGRQLDLRVSAIPTLYGESVVMRLLDRSSVLLAPDDLGFPADVRQRFDTLIRRPNGIILVTGPTGSGKTTTLYAALSSINSVEKNIITVEDPVEYQLKGVKQIQVRPRIGLNFATGLRHIVRQDPDVILVGEIRDQETADIAIHAALTGHLVLSTLHTNDAAGAVTRLLDMGIQNYLVSSTLLAVLAQRLVRRICPHCKSPYSPSKETLAEVGIAAAESDGVIFYKGSGCAECSDTGYFGRLGIFELLVVEGDLQRLILEKTDSGTIRDKAVEMGMRTLWRDGLEKVLAGATTLDEVLRVTWEG